eukprot:COSAG05_NODE_2490_length_2995_cov_2.145028_1_plen_97_part_00
MAFTNLVKAGTRFPRIDGEEHSESWQRHIRYTNAESRRGDRDHSRTEHRTKRNGLIKCHSRRRVCIVCGGEWVEWDGTSGMYEKITRVEYWQITAE